MFLDSVNSCASDSRYLELDAKSPNNEPNGPELKKWILTVIKQLIRKNNVLVVGRMVKRVTKKA
jgi:hypothetical protein